jgi:hypothetical protein
MAQAVTDVGTLQQYMSGVLDRADHHAQNVNEVVLTLAGAIVWRKDAAPMEARTYEGKMTNILSVSIGGKRYTFRYDHEKGAVELREGSHTGSVLAAFTNATPASEIKALFAKL